MSNKGIKISEYLEIAEGCMMYIILLHYYQQSLNILKPIKTRRIIMEKVEGKIDFAARVVFENCSLQLFVLRVKFKKTNVPSV